ncbi:MAG: hypothetical protein IPL87_04440 [Candidatus Moraniibacteriota bacterium]|nr:MAG: hypothetical protein IPL87_04440 [Candidatus Moranbacteria bacterium]
MSQPLPSRSSSPLLFWALFLLIIVMVAMVFLALRSFVGENNPEGKDMISNAPGPKSEKSIPENLSKEVEKNMQSTSGFVREMITKDDADGVWVKLVSAPESNAEKASSSVESLFTYRNPQKDSTSFVVECLSRSFTSRMLLQKNMSTAMQ